MERGEGRGGEGRRGRWKGRREGKGRDEERRKEKEGSGGERIFNTTEKYLQKFKLAKEENNLPPTRALITRNVMLYLCWD